MWVNPKGLNSKIGPSSFQTLFPLAPRDTLLSQNPVICRQNEKALLMKVSKFI
jgi:hypothetical protein